MNKKRPISFNFDSFHDIKMFSLYSIKNIAEMSVCGLSDETDEQFTLSTEMYQTIQRLIRQAASGQNVTFCIDAFPTWVHGKITGVVVVETARVLGFADRKVNETTAEELEAIVDVIGRLGANVARLENNEGFKFQFNESDVPVTLRIK